MKSTNYEVPSYVIFSIIFFLIGQNIVLSTLVSNFLYLCSLLNPSSPCDIDCTSRWVSFCLLLHHEMKWARTVFLFDLLLTMCQFDKYYWFYYFSHLYKWVKSQVLVTQSVLCVPYLLHHKIIASVYSNVYEHNTLILVTGRNGINVRRDQLCCQMNKLQKLCQKWFRRKFFSDDGSHSVDDHAQAVTKTVIRMILYWTLNGRIWWIIGLK